MKASAVLLTALVLPLPLYLSAQTPTPTPTAPSQTEAALDVADARALALLTSIHEHEIATADLLQGRQVSGGVREYAARLEREHQAQLSTTRDVAMRAGISPQQTPDVVAYEASTIPARERLDALPAEAFERGYVDGIVRTRSDMLQVLDQDLIRSATNPDVIAHLRATRDLIAAQLADGQALSGRLAAAD